MQKPKLAIMLAGHMRSYKLTLPSFLSLRESLKEKYECKTFIHTWDRSESETQSYYKRPDFKADNIDYKLLSRLYSPESMLIEHQEKIENDEIVLHNQSKYGLICSEYSKFRVNQLKKDSGEFDYALLIRPDLQFYNTSLPEINSEHFYIGSVNHSGAACDAISFSTSSSMDKARDYYLLYKYYLESFQMMNNEAYFLKYLNETGFSVKFAKYYMPRDWKIVRSWWPSVDYYESDRKIWDHSYAG